jgi:hypothetical protein
MSVTTYVIQEREKRHLSFPPWKDVGVFAEDDLDIAIKDFDHAVSVASTLRTELRLIERTVTTDESVVLGGKT